jgi:hypothetical protein
MSPKSNLASRKGAFNCAAEGRIDPREMGVELEHAKLRGIYKGNSPKYLASNPPQQPPKFPPRAGANSGSGKNSRLRKIIQMIFNLRVVEVLTRIIKIIIAFRSYRFL